MSGGEPSRRGRGGGRGRRGKHPSVDRYQQLTKRLQADSKRTAWPLKSYDIDSRATFGE